MKIKRTIALLCALNICVFSFGGCSKKDNSSSETSTTTTSQTTTVTTTTAPQTTTTQATTTTPEPEPKGNLNNLTGLYTLSESAVGKRPVAIMVNNISVSLPQYGIYDADIMFECPVEGGITRLMAVYGDVSKIPDVCSIRSCRYYYAIFAMGLDAVYFHYGLDKTVAQDTLNKFSTDHIDGGFGSNAFYRDQSRVGKYSTEHTMAIDGSAVEKAIKSAGIDVNYEEGKGESAFNFRETAQKLSDTECKKLTINFSNYYYSDFSYDEKSKTYKKFHNGSKHVDSSNSKQLEYTNVFCLETTTKVINSNNGLISLDWKGGSGYYVSQGTVMPIKWSKASETAPLVFTDQEGNELEVNPGKSYLGFTNKGTIKLK